MGRALKVLGVCALTFAFLIPCGHANATAPQNDSGRSGVGYWLASNNAVVIPTGDAANLGFPARFPNAPVVGISAKPGGQGYVLAGADGGVFTRGSAHFFGSMGGRHLNRPVVGIAYTPTGNGYYLVAADGGIFTFGDAHFYGSAGSLPLRAPIVGMAVTPSGHGYWLVAADGGVFRYGDAHFYGSAASLRLRAPIAGMAATTTGLGYWLVGADGGVFTFGDAHFYGSATGLFGNAVGIAASPTGHGYLVATSFGAVAGFGDAVACGGGGFGLPLGAVGNFTARNAASVGVVISESPSSFVGIAVPFDSSTLSSFLAASCDSISNAFQPTTPWHIDVVSTNSGPYEYPYCTIDLLRANLAGATSPILDEITAETGSRVEVRSAQMAGNASVRIFSQPSCVVVARSGAGGTQTLPFSNSNGGDSLPFTKGSNITVDVSSARPCQVEIFDDADGHFVDGHFGSHAHLTIPAGTYFMRTDPDCDATVS